MSGSQLRLEQTPMGLTVTANSFAAVQGTHSGTGEIKGTEHYIVPSSVNQPIDSQLNFVHQGYAITVMSFEIATNLAPNWFGVSFRQDIRSFNTVNIFCHPFPGSEKANMKDTDYQTRSGNWPNLFRYAEILGRQMDYANSDVVVIVPFFNSASYTNTGIFAKNWRDIVEQILALASKHHNARIAAAAANAKPPQNIRAAGSRKDHVFASALTSRRIQASAAGVAARLKHVVLSDFSIGRQLMWSIRHSAGGLREFLREVWDFDGLKAPPPLTGDGVRGILYNQSTDKRRVPDVFHVPPPRWLGYHHAVIPNVHSNIPAMLACHAASISAVGR